MRIEEFKSNFKIGARPNLYKVEIAGLPSVLQFLCKSAQLPDKQLGVIDVPYMGKKIKVAGEPTFSDWSVTIILDEDYRIKKELEKWMSKIEKNSSAEAANDIKQYKVDGYVIHLGNKGNEIAKYKMIGMFPNNMAQIDLGFETNDQIAEYQVTFSFDYWLRDDID